MKTAIILLTATIVTMPLVGLTAQSAAPSLSDQSSACLACHQETMPGLAREWQYSRHSQANVGCFECHSATKGEPDAREHNGYTIATVVSPKDCSRCHETEYSQFVASHHADAGAILGSLDNTIGEVIEGPTAANNGCKQCHGSVVQVNADGSLDPATWPNTGMGRINPDGSKGSCSACHSRHSFDVSLARQPENCGKCHLGPDHPQKEIYEESKHGIAYYSNVGRMNLDNGTWIVGVDYSAAPTCATCHMSATSDLPLTHDVGARVSWTLRPAISERIDAAAVKAGKPTTSWQVRRNDMKAVCGSCHAPSYIDNAYAQYDNAVELYNCKFATPATDIYQKLRSSGLITSSVDFDDKIEWTYYYLWHHEGRRARMGSAMFAPDFTQWHGFFEVADRFYMEFLPQVKEIVEQAKAAGGEKAKAATEIERQVLAVLDTDEHRWLTGSEPAEIKAARRKAAEEFRKRYAQ